MEQQPALMERARAGVNNPGDSRNQLSLLGAGSGGLHAAVATGEFLDPAGGIDELLFAGEEGVTGGANTDLDIPACRAGMIDRAAGADNIRLVVLRMNVRFHGGKESAQ